MCVKRSSNTWREMNQDTLDKLTVPYVIGGSMASIIHGVIRTTMDADIVADLKPEQVQGPPKK